MEEIIMPAQIEMERRNSLAETQNNSPSPKKTNRTLNSIQNDSRQKYFKKKLIHSAHTEQTHLPQNKQQKSKEFFDSIIFIRKSKPTSNVRVVSLGTQIHENLAEQQIFRKRYSLIQRRWNAQPQFQKMNRSVYAQKANAKEEFKKLNHSLMNKLKQGSHSKERQATQRLNKTLKNFMKQQLQI